MKTTFDTFLGSNVGVEVKLTKQLKKYPLIPVVFESIVSVELIVN